MVDGCFWHGCPEHFHDAPKVNGWYWSPKIARNRERDLDTDRRLLEVGWKVVRVWEHEQTAAAADRVEAAVRQARSRSSGGVAT
jgi:DNA mismatch endonuclease (patch repair protein)